MSKSSHIFSIFVTLAVCVAGAVLFISFPVTGADRVYLDIDSPTAKKIPVAVPELKNLGGDAALGKEAAAQLARDLDFTGYFRLIDPKGFLGREQGDEVDYKGWSLTGADLLVKGTYRTDGAQVAWEFRLYDLLQGKMILGRGYRVAANDYKVAVHRFADEILYLFTGEHGPFQTQLAFISTVDGHKEIFVSDFDGSNARRLTRHQSITLTPRWSPRGNEIAYTSYKDGGPALYILKFPALQTQRISNRPGVNITPAWHPDGESLALAVNHKGNSQIIQVNRSGTLLNTLTQSWGIDVSPAWSPDGRQLAFVSNRSGNPQIYILDVATRQVRRLTFQGSYNTGPVWSPKGNWIAYAGRVGGQFQIFTIAPGGGEAQQLTQQGNNESPDFSPDGSMIVFSSNRHGKAALYVMNANGANQRRITFLPGEQTSPSWGPR
jgi:TolB protein